MNIENLRTRAEHLETIATRERAACARTLGGVGFSGKRFSRRVQMLAKVTKSIAIHERTVHRAGEEPETFREVLHFTRAGYAGHCTGEAISARKAYEQALAEATG